LRLKILVLIFPIRGRDNALNAEGRHLSYRAVTPQIYTKIKHPQQN